MSKYLVNEKNKQIFNGIIPRYEKAIETFLITLKSGYSFAEDAQNKCYYNKITKQVTLVYYINGPMNTTWKDIGTIPKKYCPQKTIYIESTSGVNRSLIKITKEGTVQAWVAQENLNAVRGTATYYTF